MFLVLFNVFFLVHLKDERMVTILSVQIVRRVLPVLAAVIKNGARNNGFAVDDMSVFNYKSI